MGIRGTHQASQNNGTEVRWCKEERKGSIAHIIGLAMEIHHVLHHNTSMYNTTEGGNQVYCILLSGQASYNTYRGMCV